MVWSLTGQLKHAMEVVQIMPKLLKKIFFEGKNLKSNRTSYYGLKGTPTYCIVFAVLCCLIQALYTFLWPIQCYEHWWYVGLHTFKQEHLKEQDIWPSLILCAFLLTFEFKSLNWQQCHWVDCKIYWEYRTASQLSWPFSLRANNKFASTLITVICFNCSRN